MRVEDNDTLESLAQKVHAAEHALLPAVIARLNGEMNKMFQDADLRKTLDAQGMAVAGGTAEDVERRMRVEHDRWAKILRESNIKIQG